MHLLNILEQGRENAISMERLAVLMGISERSVRKQVAEQRKKGVPIVGDNCGYYLPGNQGEWQEYIKLTRSRSIGSLTRLAAGSKEMNKDPNQLSFKVE